MKFKKLNSKAIMPRRATTGEACINTNRGFIGIEINKNHFETASKRLGCE